MKMKAASINDIALHPVQHSQPHRVAHAVRGGSAGRGDCVSGSSRWAPRHVPTLRAGLAQALRARATQTESAPGEFANLAEMLLSPRFTVHARALAAENEARTADLYWATAAMVDAALDASHDVPAWTPAAVLPAPVGLMLFEDPLPAITVAGVPQEHWPVGALGIAKPPTAPVVGVLWAQGMGLVTITLLTRREHLAPYRWVDVPAGTNLWVVNEVTVGAATTIHPEQMTGEAGVLAFLASAWLLMGQPNVARTQAVQPAAGPKRSGRHRSRSLPAPVSVSVVDLRPARYGHASGSHDTERTYRHRWIVRGHWRQQAYGVGRCERRPTWVPSHVKGPADAPLLVHERVRVWRR